MIARSKKIISGSTMVFAAVFVTLMTAAAGSYMAVVSSSSAGTERIGQQQQAFYAAEAGAYHLLQQLNDSGTTSVSGSIGSGTYSGNYAATFSNEVITSTGTVNGFSRTVTVRTLPLPAYVSGAVTVNSSVTTSGAIVVDGRDHDANGNLTGAPGVNGITASGIISQSGSSTIGGNGYAPSSPASALAMEQSVTPFPSTAPWDVLGVPQAWFEANVPVQATPPNENFSGIYYYDPPGGIWNPVDLGNASGILIVHNATNTAIMKNLHGNFKGLIISDQITHINGDASVLGAVITTNQVGNTLGNGNATVQYSSAILSQLASLAAGQTSGWKRSMHSGSWKEQ